ncbi:MAG: uroporphyrinogen-III C-methyltransferase [Burkholderiales bacterium]|nr:uroporphyrinogen-III C-methyltransferase [Burkholderiales bacterium]
MAVVGALSVASLVLAWRADQRGASLEQELVRRQQDSAGQAAEARLLAKQAQEGMAEATAKVSLLEARVAEVAVQRSQLEELIQSLSRSRDENLLVDVEAAIRVALQQSAITGSAEPLVVTLKQSDDRLARYNQPRLEGVRRAIARDLDRIKATSLVDVSTLAIKLDEAIRLVDELPLLAVAEPRKGAGIETGKETGKPAARARAAAAGVSASTLAASAPVAWSGRFGELWSTLGERIWGEVRSLVRVTRIDHPDAMLLAPEQSFFVRENLKLRLLNARLALLSRQFDTAQSDLQAAQHALDRYFDRASKRTVLAAELIRQVAAQAHQVGVPRPDDTLAALTAATAGR